ncbi:MAG: four helix bundle protein [Flavobacteriales bacterium]
MTAEELKLRTKKFAIATILFLRTIKYSEEMKVIRYQLIKAATSMAANYRAACQGRSDNEFYSKICIVVEENDESIFWLEFPEETQECEKEKCKTLLKEGGELLLIFSKTKNTLGNKIGAR